MYNKIVNHNNTYFWTFFLLFYRIFRGNKRSILLDYFQGCIIIVTLILKYYFFLVVERIPRERVSGTRIAMEKGVVKAS